MKFRKKPIIVEAEQFTHPATPPRGVHIEEDGRAYVMTIHLQKVYLETGDWILPEPDGEHFYPVKPDIFSATYEPITDHVVQVFEDKPEKCQVPPPGWHCTRHVGHEGPCAAVPQQMTLRETVIQIIQDGNRPLRIPEIEVSLKQHGNWNANTFDVRDVVADLVEEGRVEFTPGRLVHVKKLKEGKS